MLTATPATTLGSFLKLPIACTGYPINFLNLHFKQFAAALDGKCEKLQSCDYKIEEIKLKKEL